MLRCPSTALNLDLLGNGQSFRWKKLNDGSWIGVMANRIWKICRKDCNNIDFEVLHNYAMNDHYKETSAADTTLLKHYFQLDVNLESLCNLWVKLDPHFAQIISRSGEYLCGIRILKLMPLEALVSFICSSNNNIKRISGMVARFCELFGSKCPSELIKDLQITDDNFSLNDFPSIEAVSKELPQLEQLLRDAGFGYRAKFICKTFQALSQNYNEFGGGNAWLESLIKIPYFEAKASLMELPGVGPKVADCICLMALSKHEVVPIDTHILNTTIELYKPKFIKPGKGKSSLSNAAYEEIAKFYIDLFGAYAGWAQSILFSLRLKRL